MKYSSYYDESHKKIYDELVALTRQFIYLFGIQGSAEETPEKMRKFMLRFIDEYDDARRRLYKDCLELPPFIFTDAVMRGVRAGPNPLAISELSPQRIQIQTL